MATFQEIADYITDVGTTNTSNGSYYVYFSDIEKHFNLPIGWVKVNAEDIEECFDWDVVAECDIDDESFGMYFNLHYVCEKCATYIDGNRCYDECCNCECWCDNMDEDYEYKEVEYKPYAKSPELIEAELRAEQWLKGRQKELSTLKFRRYETDLWMEQKVLLAEAGYFVYDLRDWDEGNGFNIELHVAVNHIGCWVTDIDLIPYMNHRYGHWVGIDELKFAQIEEIPYAEIKELLDKGKELHFANKKGD